MNQLTESTIHCPYCGEPIDVLLDPGDIDVEYIEDCQVCCKPINFFISEEDSGTLNVRVSSDDEV